MLIGGWRVDVRVAWCPVEDFGGIETGESGKKIFSWKWSRLFVFNELRHFLIAGTSISTT